MIKLKEELKKGISRRAFNAGTPAAAKCANSVSGRR
jgi:hypothetical protein